MATKVSERNTALAREYLEWQTKPPAGEDVSHK